MDNAFGKLQPSVWKTCDLNKQEDKRPPVLICIQRLLLLALLKTTHAHIRTHAHARTQGTLKGSATSACCGVDTSNRRLIRVAQAAAGGPRL